MTDTPAVNERIARRRAEVRAARRRRRLRRTLLVAATLVVVVGLVLLERSSLVALADVEVVGLERLDEATVLETAGVAEGMSVLRIRTGRVEERVTALPLVDHATAERVGPLGLRIQVTEVAPALTARFPTGTVLVSEQGLVLGEGEAPGTMVVEVSGRAPEPGATVAASTTLAAAHEVVLGLPGPVAALVDLVRAPVADDVLLVLENGIQVQWGDATRGDEKARALGAVLEDLDGRKVQIIDVRAPMAPTVTP